MKLKEFEKHVIHTLVGHALPAGFVQELLAGPGEIELEWSGSGYFLTLHHPGLPQRRIVCNQPVMIGEGGGTQVGFVVFIQDHQLTLECHPWTENVPRDFRDQPVSVIRG